MLPSYTKTKKFKHNWFRKQSFLKVVKPKKMYYKVYYKPLITFGAAIEVILKLLKQFKHVKFTQNLYTTLN